MTEILNTLNHMKNVPAIPLSFIHKFNIFRGLDAEEMAVVKKAVLLYVFGKTGYIVTTDDEVYARKPTDSGNCFLKIPALSGFKIKDFISGNGETCFAISEAGALYTWKSSDDIQSQNFATQISEELEGKQVVQLAASSNRTVALTEEGQLFIWEYSNSYNKIVPTPIKPEQIDERKVTAIAACTDGFAAIVDTGELYIWAWGFKQPTLCGIRTTFKKVTATDSSLYALSDGGLLYRFTQKNPSGYLFHQKVIDVGADSKRKHVVYEMYDEVHTFSEVDAQVTNNFDSMDDAFLLSFQSTFRTINSLVQFAVDDIAGKGVKANVADLWHCGGRELELEEDVAFLVDGKRIEAHRTILMLRSAYFRKMFNGNWKESKEECIPIGETYEVFKGFLAFLYTDKIPFSGKEYEFTFALMQLADSYLEPTLHNQCEKQLMGNLSIQNICYLLKKAAPVNAHNLHRRALSFFVDNRKQAAKLWTYAELRETLGDDILGELYPLFCIL